ncbi:MAG: amidohydrolase family protein [Chloroflexota bacterium]|nr:amidohydrolase family protein [Chloroflexota bacterium]MDE2947839.1 amidohydrolase family protein [Chloroflexota bacterium]
MSSLLIHNIGQIVSGDYEEPLLAGDSILARDGIIAAIGGGLRAGDGETAIDAKGATVTPGLIDSHTHPVIGDYSPRQNTADFIASCVHGGVTRMISAGEVHMPGRPTGAIGTKAMAIVGAKAWRNFRPGGMKVQGGGLLLQAGLTEADFAEMAAAGVKHLGEVGLGGFHDWDRIAEMARWAKGCGMTVMMHIGGASIPGSDAIGAEQAIKVRPHIASHLNGGPTAPALSDIERIIVETDAALELIQCGNAAIIPRILDLARQHNALDRVIIGSDMPSGTGVIPLGILRTIAWVSALGDIPPAQAIAMATGATAALYKFPAGRIEPGLEADLVIMDAPIGGAANDALETLQIGDTPGISGVIIDGELVARGSRNTPPARRQLELRP